MVKIIYATFAAVMLSAIGAPALADDEADVRAAILAADHVFEAHDATLARTVYAPDVVWQNPFGVRLHSEKSLEAFLTNLFHRPGYLAGKETSKTEVLDIRILGSDTAAGWTIETSEGQIEDSTGKPIGARKSHTLDVLRKHGGKWWVTDELIMDEKTH